MLDDGLEQRSEVALAHRVLATSVAIATRRIEHREVERLLRRIEVDAAILFSDLLIPLEPMGLPFDFVKGEGPQIERPIRTPQDIAALKTFDPRESLGHVLEAIRQIQRELAGRVPLIGFAGAPFTVASYLIEGRPSRTYQNTKKMMHTDEVLWHEVMERLVQHSVLFISAQLTAGAEAFQVFDSWAGALDRADYDRFVKPHTTAVFSQLAELHPGVAGIHYGIGCDHLLESMNTVGNSVIGLDWRTPISAARTRLGADTVVQGNLDPALVLAGTDVALAGADKVLAENAGHPGHIFNLGHGITPQARIESFQAVLDAVVASGV